MVQEKLVCLGKYNPVSNKHTTHTFYSTEDFLQFCFKKEIKEIYGYNIKFDSRFFIDFLLNHSNASFKTIRGGSAILSLYLEYNGKSIRFRDFYPFCLGSLDSIAKSLELKYQKYPNFPDSDKAKWENFFRYCTLEQLEKHCILDVKMLAELIDKYRWSFYKEHKIDIMGRKIFSLAGLSMKVLRIHYITTPINNPFIYRDGRDYKIDKPQYDFVRKSYHGGYTGNIDSMIHKDIISYDISSSYPFQCIREKFPTGSAIFTDKEEIFREKTKEIAGFCELTVDFSTTTIKFPVFDDELEEFITLNKKWKGVLTSIEYYYLLEMGVDVTFNIGLYYSDFDESYCLERYMKEMYSKKSLAKTPALRLIAKRLINALTGKFGQRINLENRLNERIILSKDVEDLDSEITTYSEKLNNKISYCYELEKTESLKAYTIPSWISIICAKGRIQLLRMIELVKAKYFDTDSVYFDSNKEYLVKDINKGRKGLGCWDLEHRYSKFRAIAPKLYAGKLLKEEKGSIYFVRSKGININNDEKLRKELYHKIINCEDFIEFKQLRPLSLRQALRVKNVTDISISGLVKSNEYMSKNKMKVKF